MKCIYFDCFAGISGDMTLGALVDLGVPQKYLRGEIRKLGLDGWRLRISRAERNGISARTVQVAVAKGSPGHHHRTYGDIESIISKSALNVQVKEKALDIFHRIARAEAQIHNMPVTDVHFHEVGALDSIVDIVGCVAGFDFLGAEAFRSARVPLGQGFVTCRHGTIPVPAPATMRLLEGIPVYASGVDAELVTPTGAAILASFVTRYGPLPAMVIQKTGYGAGGRELERIPNMLRLVLGQLEVAGDGDPVLVLEANIDDMNPEWTGYLMERLFEAGALDVSIMPVYMKKNRPGVLLQVICREQERQEVALNIFQESTTAGIRFYRAERWVLGRRTAEVDTRYGTVTVKIFTDDRGEHTVPEFESCRAVARAKKVPVRDVYSAVIAATARRK